MAAHQMEAKRYNRKVCLFILWESGKCINCGENTSAPCKETCDVARFTRTLSKGYGFEMIIYRIPTSAAHLAMDKYMEDFIKIYSNPDTLLLLYYAGHGGFHEQRGLRCGLGNSESSDIESCNQFLYCRQVIRQLVSASSDVLIILDCCHSVPRSKGICLSTPLPPQGGKTEMIGACYPDQVTLSQFRVHLNTTLKSRYKKGMVTFGHHLPKHIEQERKESQNSGWERIIGEDTGTLTFPVSDYFKLHLEKGTIILTPSPNRIRRTQQKIKRNVKDKLWKLSSSICSHIVNSGSW
ncbi:hypothetical protein BKA65DRAFT_474172 [Rhexocercosporidium sp. MPI-PUGE-AT-0058]|nr:hypothetical protein BKA65DRAFT_474172 [Rhexocercosporidium sp. MPI-PUGE-AT-0058]